MGISNSFKVFVDVLVGFIKFFICPLIARRMPSRLCTDQYNGSPVPAKR